MKIQNNSLENIKQLNYSLLKNESVILVYSSLNGLFYCTEQFFQLFKEVSLDEDFSYEDLIDILPIKHQKILFEKIDDFRKNGTMLCQLDTFIYENNCKVTIELKVTNSEDYFFLYFKKRLEITPTSSLSILTDNLCIKQTVAYKNIVTKLEYIYYRSLSKIYQFGNYYGFKVWHYNINEKKIILPNGVINNFKFNHNQTRRFLFKNISECDFKIIDKWLEKAIEENRFNYLFLKTENDKQLANNWNHNYLYFTPGSDIDSANLLCITKEIDEINNNKYELEKIIKHIKYSESVKTHFLTHLSHELRTPLNIITGFSEIMLNDKNNYSIEYNQAIAIANKSLLSQINSISDYISIVTNDYKVAPQNVYLWSFINDLKNEYEEKNNHFIRIMFVNNKDNLVLLTDKYLLKIAINKLIDNSVNNTTSGYIIIEYIETDNDIDIIVTDSGTGIKDNDINRVVLPFEKADEFSEGVGLGLTIVKSIAQKLGAEIRITSEIGVGTSIHFTINTQSDFIPYISTYDNDKALSNLGKVKIIYIFCSDNNYSTFSLKNIFPDYIFRLFTVENEMIDALDEENPSMFIVDVDDEKRKNHVVENIIKFICPNKTIIICESEHVRSLIDTDERDIYLNKPVSIIKIREHIISSLHYNVYE